MQQLNPSYFSVRKLKQPPLYYTHQIESQPERIQQEAIPIMSRMSFDKQKKDHQNIFATEASSPQRQRQNSERRRHDSEHKKQDIEDPNSQKYMRQDTESHSIVSRENLTKMNQNLRWHWSFFLEFLFYHLVNNLFAMKIYFFVLGPSINLLFWYRPGLILLRNMEFYGLSFVNFVQTFIFLTNLYCSLSYFIFDHNKTIQLCEMVYFWALIFNICLIISAKYATFSLESIKIYKTLIIDTVAKKKLQYLHYHTLQSSEARYIELYAAFQRNEFESSQFYLSFFNQPNKNFIQSVEHLNQQLKQHHHSQFVQYQADPLIPNDQQFYGFGIANKLIQSYEDQSSWKSLLVYSLVLSLLMSLVSVTHFIYQMNPNGYRILFYILTVLSETYCGFICLIFLLTSLRECKKRKYFLIQCGFLISPQKVQWDDFQKVLPTLNITDSHTIIAWSMLRQICFDYGKQYTLRTQAFYSFIIFYCIVVTFIIILYLLKIIHLDYFSLIYLGVGDLIFFSLIIFLFIEQAYLNEFFLKYENYIEDWINIIHDIQRMQEFYFNQNIIPNNFLHRKIVDSILQKTNGYLEAGHRLQLIQLNFQDALRHLRYDERNNSSKFYGITITFEILWSILVGSAALVLLVLNSQINST